MLLIRRNQTAAEALTLTIDLYPFVLLKIRYIAQWLCIFAGQYYTGAPWFSSSMPGIRTSYRIDSFRTIVMVQC